MEKEKKAGKTRSRSADEKEIFQLPESCGVSLFAVLASSYPLFYCPPSTVTLHFHIDSRSHHIEHYERFYEQSESEREETVLRSCSYL